eukprot:9482734-Pyramimonas_sp.AAC.1
MRSFGSDMDARFALARGGTYISMNNEARAFFNGAAHSLDVIPALIHYVLGLPEKSMQWAPVGSMVREQPVRQPVARIDLAPTSAPSAFALVPLQQAD